MACARFGPEIRLAVEGGVWSLEQGVELGTEDAEMMARQGTYYVPGAQLFYEADEKTKSIVVDRTRREYDGMAERLLVSIARARRAGVRIAAGSDAMYHTHGQNARELVALVMTGLTPRQAIVAATRIAAEACGIDHLVGTLEPGKLADMLLVKGNPLEDIRILTEQDRLTVFKEGLLV